MSTPNPVPSRTVREIFGLAAYEPHRPAPPGPDIEHRLREAAPPGAWQILEPALEGIREGVRIGSDTWEKWLHLFRAAGPDDDAVQVTLAGLLYQSHELRHHVDFFLTPLGTNLVLALVQEYGYITQLASAPLGSARFDEIVQRLRRHNDIRRTTYGRVTALDPREFKREPLLSVDVGFARIRIREPVDVARHGNTVTTIAGPGRPERVVSMHTALETRAMVETCLWLSSELTKVGASEAEADMARRVALANGLDGGQDEYLAVLEAVGRFVGADGDIREALERKSGELMLTAWFALHSPPLENTVRGTTLLPMNLYVVALQRAFQHADRGIDLRKWAEFLELLWSQFSPEETLTDVLRASYQRSARIFDGLEQPTGEITGRGAAHVKYLALYSMAGLDARLEDGADWTDKYSFSVDPFIVTSWDDDPPLTIDATYARLDTFRTMLRQPGFPPAALQDAARALTR